jgi:actin-related protein 9
MVAKVAFGESQGKHSISKIDYNAHGPSAIYGVWQD